MPTAPGPPSREFDGGLLQRWTYLLTAEDALTYLRLPRPMPRLQRLGLGSAALLWGSLVAALPSGVTGDWGSPRFITILAGGAILGALGFLVLRDLSRRRQARRWMPTPRPGTLEEWTDCIAITRLDANEEDYLSPELIAGVSLTRRHLLVHGPGDPLIVPLSAFASPAEAMEIATYISNLSKGPYYFDP
ncbi:MAG: hypothetical protein ABI832_06120 [bacterium]